MNIFPTWMYHHELEPALAMDKAHSEALQKKGYVWLDEHLALKEKLMDEHAGQGGLPEKPKAKRKKAE